MKLIVRRSAHHASWLGESPGRPRTRPVHRLRWPATQQMAAYLLRLDRGKTVAPPKGALYYRSEYTRGGMGTRVPIITTALTNSWQLRIKSGHRPHRCSGMAAGTASGMVGDLGPRPCLVGVSVTPSMPGAGIGHPRI